MSQKSGTARRSSAHHFTEKQGQYLAFICVYKRMFGQSPAEADMQRHFRVSPPSVHQMVLGLERDGLIRRLQAPPEASTSSSRLRKYRSSRGSTRQNLCDELLVP